MQMPFWVWETGKISAIDGENLSSNPPHLLSQHKFWKEEEALTKKLKSPFKTPY